jgi:hypothetical protein
MLMEIGTTENIPKFIARAKAKNDPFRLMGFGHRVYKNYDPRAKIMQRICHDVLNELGIKDSPLLEVAMALRYCESTGRRLSDRDTIGASRAGRDYRMSIYPVPTRIPLSAWRTGYLR